MKCFKKFSKDAASVYDEYKTGNPLMMRKKMAVTDVVFRRDEPDRELLRMEFNWDGEVYLLLALLILLLVLTTCKICRWFR